jgi:hypothetical protein
MTMILRKEFNFEIEYKKGVQNAGTERLFKVSHIYWDTAHRRLPAYGRSSDGEPADPADAIPYSVHGTNGIRQLAEDYEAKEGLQATIPSVLATQIPKLLC